MAIVLLPLVFALLWLQVWSRRTWFGSAALSRRGAFLLAYLLFEALLLVMTELTSVGHHFTRATVLGCWLALAAGLLLVSWRELVAPLKAALGSTRPHPVHRMTSSLMTEATAWLAIPFFYLGVLVYLGIVYLPSNGDSLDYHLVRVEHWIQDQSVAPFAAHFTAQIDYPPLAEYNLAHFHLLVGGDRLDGFVQLFAAVVCVVAVSEITRLLGGTRLVQVGAVVICTTIPSVVLSATSTENNLFLASLCACLLYVLIGQPLAPWWRFAGFAGLAAGLAVTTKGTTVLLIGPTAAMLVLWRIVTESGVAVMAKVGRTVVVVGIVGVMVALLAGPSLYQNQKLFGSFDGPDAQAVLSSDLTWRAAGANIVRATAANFMMGNGTSGPETAISKFVLAKLHGVYGAFGVRQGNPNYFEGPESTVFFDAFQVRDYDQWVRSEDEGADPLQVVLMCFAATACLILVVRGDRRMRVLALMAGTLTLGYLLLAGIAWWQIFEVRFFIPLFVAWTPLVAIALARCSRWLLRITMVVLALACLPQLLDNTERPVRRDSYGANPLAPYLLDSLDRSYIVNTAAGLETLSKVLAQSTCHQLGIGDFVVIEYPVWVGLHDERWRGEIEDVNVQNPSARYESRDFHPCAVLTEPPALHVSAVGGGVQMDFAQQLALSIRPADMRTVRVPVAGFDSQVAQVRVYPGSGWSFQGAPLLHGKGSLFIYSPRAETLYLGVEGPHGEPRSGVAVSAPRSASPAAVTGPSGRVQIGVSAGVTQVTLTNPRPVGAAPAVTGIDLGAGTG